MDNIRHSSPFNIGIHLVPSLLLVLGCFLLYPYYKYYIDPDAVSYLTIAQRYATADYSKAINGLWNPLACWLTAIGIRQGWEPFNAALLVNAIAAICFLNMTMLIARSFIFKKRWLWALALCLTAFLWYAIIKQSFADLWGFSFTLLALHWLLKPSFYNKPIYWVGMALLIVVTYYAKSYCFNYQILLLIVCTLQHHWPLRAASWKKLLQMGCVMIPIVAIGIAPWVFALHEKYGVWTLSNSGSLNTSWFLIGHPIFKEGIQNILPPIYEDSYSYWEDPWFVNGPLPQFYHSLKLMGMQLVRLGFNFLKMVRAMNELSPFFFPIFLTAIIGLANGRLWPQNIPQQRFRILLWAIVLFPSGYIMVNFESRYLWYMMPLSLIAFITSLQYVKFKWKSISIALFLASYLVFPVLDMKALFKVGYREQALAQKLMEAGIHGSFMTNVPYNSETQHIHRLSYFSKNPYYFLIKPYDDKAAMLREMQGYNIQYYYWFRSPHEQDVQLLDANGKPYLKVFEDNELWGLSVFQLHP